MDMLPPETPARYGATREAEMAQGALQRLAAAHGSLSRLQDEAPAWRDPPPRDMAPYLDSLDAYWSTHIESLATTMQGIWRDEATLRSVDGTLPADAADLIRRVTNQMADDRAVRWNELVLGQQALAGAVVVSADAVAGHHLLFLPGVGWESFPSLDTLASHVQREFLQGGAHPVALRGMTTDAYARARTARTVSLRPLGSQPARSVARRLVQVQREQIALAWDDLQLDRDLEHAAATFSDRAHAYLHMAQRIDVPTLLRTREHRLVGMANEERLARVPAEAANAWRDATRAYASLAVTVATLRPGLGIDAPATPAGFTDRELSARLVPLGITDAPADLVVEITHMPFPGSYEHLTQWVRGADTVQQSLRELAWRGLSSLDRVSLRVMRRDGAGMATALPESSLRTLIRDVRLADRYREYLEQMLRASHRGAAGRAIDVEMLAARMRAEATEARLSYYLADEPRSFRHDHAERGYRWVEAVLDHRAAAGRARVEGHDIVVRQATYRGAAVRDVFIIGVRNPASVGTLILYTPDSPDGVSFREFDDAAGAQRNFFYAPAFREYLLDRLPAAFAEFEPNGVTRRFAGGRTVASWVFGQPGGGAFTRTAEAFGERDVTGDFFAAGYDTMVDQRLHDAGTLQSEARRWAFDPLGRNPVTGLLADAVIETARAPARTFQALNRFYDHVKAGDGTAAYLAFTEAYTSALDITAPPWFLGRARRPLIRPSLGAAPQSASFQLPLPGVRFESRYAAPGIDLTGVPDRNGVYRVGMQHYIQQDGHAFAVRYDHGFDTYRLQPAGGSAVSWGPAIQRTDTCGWAFNDVGLAGGAGRGLRDRFRRLLHLDHERAPAAQPPAGAAALPDPAPAEAAAPVANLRLPEALEPRRAELEAAFRDNPGMVLMTRHGSNDSLHMRMEVPTRSAVIHEDGVAADLRTLDPGQRRFFMHELETQFPDPLERSQVLARRGWASDGRRVPSRTEHTWHGDDGQDPAISSSSDTTVTDPRADLSATQNQRWDETVAAARRHPTEAADPALQSLGRAAEFIEPDDWPDRLWVYTDQRPARRLGSQGQELVIRPAPGESLQAFHNYRVTTLPPGTPRAQLEEVLGVTPGHRLGGRDPLAYWVQIDTRYMRDAFRRPNHALDRRQLASGEYAYTLHTWNLELRVPHSYTFTAPRQ
ncbi:hypothetical protein [Luteibacter aegosomatissinici]|uniref:hypothetical protein n=1 Tax=Luteibacter aegosomatissinici TaxID=2911539 RepID=UPI001FF98373|nr:hypothetical protein [Luteibacter aegosomatissinici]UPG94852.1 hypothetical protein L2Y97_01740 [Luteibacter aegosomatissinici]